MNMNASEPAAVQDRIMRTYEVHLDGATETVNLSYELNDRLDAVDSDGRVVPAASIAASIEVMKRLRKLAAVGRTSVTGEQIETADWDVRMVRSCFVRVPVDESGRPIARHRT